ncbi:hypothetical protein [Burkholderia sp. S171]|uniref:hypothetical protein n=1 Tax=Burkholderia sp. S171 TaxID=1641860 RepID=UPI00131B2FB0|nr:hypothetical protein [Burkholderia sp. S171]
MTDDQSPHERPQERIAAARRLYAVMQEYLDRPTWTPIEGTLILSGIHPLPGCADIPAGGVGLDGKLFPNVGNERFSDARRIWRKWSWRCEDDQENGEDTPTELPPDEFLIWCEEMDIETEWFRLYRALIDYKSQANQVDVIPAAIVEYATNTAIAVDSILIRLGAGEPNAAADTKGEKSSPRSPMPVPENREHLSTEEFAAALAVDPQSVRKRYSETGSYHGVRPTKLPSRRLLWPVAAVKRLLNGDTIGD